MSVILIARFFRTGKANLTLLEKIPPETRLRLLGLLPLIFFSAQAIHYLQIHQFGHMLWMCNIGNLLLAIGLFSQNKPLIRISSIWMIPGLFIWIMYVVLEWGVFFSSTLAHVGGLIVGMYAVRRVGMDRMSWIYAFVWFLLIQLGSRLFTSADLNVNLAHHIQPGWEQRFQTYWQFWLTLVTLTAFVLWIISVVLRRAWPADVQVID
jgi:hypothetical protein